MKKKIIVLAIALALGSPALSFADGENVIVYGRANVSFDMVNTSGAAGTRTTQVSSNSSFLGFKGSEEMDDGWTATWQIEQRIDIDNSAAGSNLFGTRNTFVNLMNGQYGVFILGRHDTPYKLASRTMDVFFDTIADNRSLMGGASLNLANLGGTSAGASFDGRQGDVIAYIAPAIGDLMITGAYVAGAEAAITNGQVKGDAWSFAGLYTYGPLNANLGYEVHHLGSSGTGTLAPIAGLENLSERAWKLGVSYAFDSFTLYGVYERTADNLGGVLGLPARSNLLGHRSYYLAGKYRLGGDTIKAAYTNAGELNMNGGGQNTGAQQWSLGYDHKLSRRTSVYALYTRLNNDSGVSFNLAPTDASTGSASASAAGADPSAFSVGMRHTF